MSLRRQDGRAGGGYPAPMVTRFPAVAVVVLVLVLPGCGGTVETTPDDEAIREAVREHLRLLAPTPDAGETPIQFDALPTAPAPGGEPEPPPGKLSGMSGDTIAILGVGAALFGSMVFMIRGQSKDLRRHIEDQGKNLRDAITAQGKNLRDALTAQGENLRREIEGQGDGLRRELDKLHDDVNEMRRELRDVGKQVARVEVLTHTHGAMPSGTSGEMDMPSGTGVAEGGVLRTEGPPRRPPARPPGR